MAGEQIADTSAVFDARRELASDLFTYMASLALLVALISPWVFVRSLLIGSISLLFCGVALVSRRACLRGHPQAAMHGHVVVVSLALLPLMAMTAHVTAPALVFIMVLPAYAAVCGRHVALAAGGVFILVSALLQYLRSHGADWPVLLPTLPTAQLALSAVVIVGVVMPLPLVFNRLMAALEQARAEIKRRQLAEQALEQARNDREIILDALPDYMFKLDSEGRILEFRSALEAEVPLISGGFRGRLMSEVFLPDTWAVVQEALQEAAAHGLSRGKVTRSPMKNGLRWFELSVVPMESEHYPPPAPSSQAQQPPSCFIMLARDITQRREEEAQRRLQALVLDQIQDHVTVTRLDGGISHVNQAVCLHYQQSAEDLCNRSLQTLELQPGSDLDGTGIWQATLQQGAWRGRVLSCDGNGQVKVLDWRTTLVKNEVPRPVAIVVVGTDVTQQEQAMRALAEQQQQLERIVAERTAEATEARRQAESSNRAKSVFLATMSHEMRTPLNAVLGHAQFLQQQDLGPARTRHLQPLVAASRHLLALVNNTLDFSKIEAGELNLVTEDFSLRELLAASLDLVREQAAGKGLFLRLKVLDEVPDALHGDALRVKQCLLNYLGNAVKFTDRGEVRLNVRLQAPTSSAGLPTVAGDPPTTVRLCFEVRDSGIGIAPELQPQLFQPFLQLDSSPTRRHGGTGLGLTVTRRLAEAMGGEVGVNSQTGRGSTFWFSLPLQAARRPHGGNGFHGLHSPHLADAPQLLRRDFSQRRVLLVEDDPINRDLFQAMVTDVGLNLDMAGNGQEALDMLANKPYDLVLMDLQMPVMDGLEATRAIRAKPCWAQLPVLGLSANAFDSDRVACEQAGMNGFIGKPVQFAEFYAQMLKALRDAQPASSFMNVSLQARMSDSEPPKPSASEADPPAAYPGLDVKAGLLTWRSATALAKYLQVFVGHYTQAPAQIRAAEPATAQALAHKLKGASAAMGLRDVTAAAASLETRFRLMTTQAGEFASSAVDADLIQLEAAMAVALDSIKRFSADQGQA